ncbi:MAG: rRNA maturation RNase YbeY [Neisseria sp.]|uniref:rRNA maturation RNase YbeY n=1 Tax=Neisseria sp. TaxID=192066 RepID=UPI0026DD9AF7|nr:rRNA maturation RNase YbeY [Neisseria sp.]MDO4640935.1 rRNA maturation RNase YbeY [Neisseria sp.]
MKQAKRYPFLKLLQSRLHLYLEDHSGLPQIPSEQQFRRWIWQAVKNRFRHAEISLILLNETDARTYNRDYRGKDYATNVLSFALDEGETMFAHQPDTLSGDLIICPQIVAKEAAEQGKPIEAHFAHLTIHGALHLMGYDHLSDEEAAVMESLEIKLLNQLAYPNPYQLDEI